MASHNLSHTCILIIWYVMATHSDCDLTSIQRSSSFPLSVNKKVHCVVNACIATTLLNFLLALTLIKTLHILRNS